MKVTKRQLRRIIKEAKRTAMEPEHPGMAATHGPSIFDEYYLYDVLATEIEKWMAVEDDGNALTRTAQDKLRAALGEALESVIQDYGS